VTAEIVLQVFRFGFLLLLWLFIFAAFRVVRADLFGGRAGRVASVPPDRSKPIAPAVARASARAVAGIRTSDIRRGRNRAASDGRSVGAEAAIERTRCRRWSAATGRAPRSSDRISADVIVGHPLFESL